MRKVLLVDDERMVLDSISQFMDWVGAGCELVASCENGYEALEAVKKFSPDIVITDVKMPVMDGIELVRRIKEINPMTEFIVLSGYGEFSFAKDALKEGVSDYLLKPCSEDDIKEALIRLSIKIQNREDYIKTEVKKGLIKNIVPEDDALQNVSSKKDFIDDVLAYVEGHYCDRDISLSQIAKDVVFLNEDYVGKRFQAKTGTKFTDYLCRKRIDRTKLMLIATEDTILEIAQKVGFGRNPQYLTKMFKKYEGMTPAEYRKKVWQDPTSI